MDSKGKILRCITKDASVLAVVMDSTAIVSEAERIHKTSECYGRARQVPHSGFDDGDYAER